MNIQIFGSKKDNDTKKAQRFFKERGIRFQYIDLREKTLSKGEFRSVAMADRRHWDISRELSNITFAGTVTTQGEKSIHCRRCGERSRIVKYSLEDEKNIGKNAFRGIPRKASVHVPAGKMKSYRKWLKKAGLKCQGGKKWKR